MIILFLIMIMAACQSSPKNEYKLSDERMAHLMLDLQLAEVALPDLSPLQQDSIRLLFKKRIEEVYQLSYEEIKSEMDLLQTDPKKLKLIIDRAKQMADSIQ
ncbi:MAG: hypothetical protein IPP15_16800 [Saprospiraceae bacterium]|uniref:DUF4296 domain-containing protein n=1 Tax=Candidatus Opimibacter skivensis TaxID=2982028 RepID=A0A9D7SVE5_9BACT|nr:hypothetical protein [Candidatus Opimibacter skivensis]